MISFTFRLLATSSPEKWCFLCGILGAVHVATVFYGLEVFVGLIQAFVFAMLTLVFAVTAVSHAES